MANKVDIFESQWVNMVFENRNHEYGAYELRKISPRNTILGIVFAIVFFSVSVSMPLILKLLEGLAPVEKVKITEVTTLAEPPPIDEKEPPPPPAEPPPPLKSTVKFTPPVIKPDEEVQEPPPTQEELKEVDASTKTQEGDANGVDQSLLEGTGNAVVEEAPPQIFTIVEQMPTFPGGDEALFKYLQGNIKYPPMEKENGISGTCYLTFVVGPEGKITDVKVLRGVKGGPNLEAEAMRVVKSMPDWKSGKQNGKAVSVQYNLPIKFTLK